MLTKAFGRDLQEVFSELQETPLGVGAIAQVYKAKIRPDIILRYMRDQFVIQDNVVTSDCVQTLDCDGKPVNIHTTVAIKVLHPKAREIVDRDLRILDFLASALTLIPTIHWISLPEEVKVFGEMMRDQLDLRVEARNLQRFNEQFGGSNQVTFPQPVLAFTTKDMLIEEFENGIPLNVFLEQAAYERRHAETHAVYDRKIANIGKFHAPPSYRDLIDSVRLKNISGMDNMLMGLLLSLLIPTIAYVDNSQLRACRFTPRQYHGQVLQAIST